MKNNLFSVSFLFFLLTTNLILAEGRLDFLKEFGNKTSDFATTWLWNGNFTDFSKGVVHAGLQHATINAFASGITRCAYYLWQQSISRFYWQVFYRNSSPYFKPQKLTGVKVPIGFSEAERIYLDKLKHPEKYAKEVRNVIFWGPPGTGKTSRARYIASECGCAFFALTPDAFSSVDTKDLPWVLRNFVYEIKRYEKVVLFIDEIDAVAQQRIKTTGENTTDQVSQSVLDLILPELSGFMDDGKLILMGSTNRMDIVDPGLKSRVTPMYIGLPEIDDRYLMLERFFLDSNIVKMPQDHLNEDVIFHLAKNTPGYSGRDLKQLAIHVGEQAIGQRKSISVGFALENLSRWEIMQGRQPKLITFAGAENKLGSAEDENSKEWANGIQNFSENFGKYIMKNKEVCKVSIQIDWERIIRVGTYSKLNLSTTNWRTIAQDVCKEVEPDLLTTLEVLKICQELSFERSKPVLNCTPHILKQLFPSPDIKSKELYQKDKKSIFILPPIQSKEKLKPKITYENKRIKAITYV